MKEKRVDELMAAITLYTTQLEDYDKNNFSACMACIGFVGGLIAAVGAILCTASNSNSSIWLNEAVSLIILLIPMMVTLFLYTFSMSCRRSALFRGYTQFLEECLNKELEKKDMLYSSFLIPEYYTKFSVNRLGPGAMFIFFLIIYVGSFMISYIFSCRSLSNNFIKGYRICSAVLFVACSVFNGLYIWTLCRNNEIIESVKEACEEKSNK